MSYYKMPTSHAIHSAVLVHVPLFINVGSRQRVRLVYLLLFMLYLRGYMMVPTHFYLYKSCSIFFHSKNILENHVDPP